MAAGIEENASKVKADIIRDRFLVQLFQRPHYFVGDAGGGKLKRTPNIPEGLKNAPIPL
jgi:hypothetical protein